MASEFDLTPSALTRIAHKLIEGGVLRVGRRDHRGQRGQPPEMMEINPPGGYAVGISLNAELCAVCLVDLSGTAVARARLDCVGLSSDAVRTAVADTVDRFIRDKDIARELLLGVGLALPVPIRPPDGADAAILNLPRWTGVPVATTFAEALDLPISQESDGNVAALSEATFGAGRHLRSFAFVNIDCGIGGGWILGRQLYRGANGNAAEFAMLHPRPGPQPSMQDLFDFLRANGAPEAAVAAVVADDPPGELVERWIARAAEQLAELVRTVAWINDPEAVIIGGSLPRPILSRLVAAVAAIDLRPDGWLHALPKVLISERAGLGLDAAAAHLPIIRDQTLFWLT
ncbi:MAG: ROK family protein [Ancalomicrobiaceae bacterium]|nr:ROK family protein [Ancalomicrobiaceae bacterium]